MGRREPQNLGIKFMKLEVQEEVIDGIIIASLNESIKDIEFSIKTLKKIKKRKEYQERDLEDCLIHLDALKRTRYYYGGVKYIHN